METAGKDLIALAAAAQEKAYAPYSHFRVGAAIECEDGSVFTGCNVENAAYGQSLCAERVAAAKAISEGHCRFRRIAVIGSENSHCYPCGACRQFLNEFSPDMEVLSCNAQGEAHALPLRELLPCSFGAESLK